MNTQCGYDVRIKTKVSSRPALGSLLPVVVGEHVDWFPVTFCIMKKKNRVAVVTHIPEHTGSGIASTETVGMSAQVQVRRLNPTQVEFSVSHWFIN